VGGVVDLVTRRESARPVTTAAASGGSFDTWTGSLSQTGRLGATELLLGGEVFRSDGDFEFQDVERVVDGQPRPGPERSFERINNRTESTSGLLSAGRDLGESWHLRASDAWFYQSAGRPGLALQSAAVDAGQSATGHLRHARNLVQLRLEGTRLAGTGLDGWASLYHRYDRSRFRDPDPPQGRPIDSDNRNHSLGTRLELARALRLGPGEHGLSLGLELREDWVDSLDFGERERGVVGVFAQDDLALRGEALRLVPALRLDHTGDQGSAWLPRLGVILRAFPWLHLKGNVERAYRVPNFDELYFDEGSLRGNPNLEPEDSFDADVGFELALARVGPLRDLWLEFAAFRRDIEQSIVFQLLGQSVVAATNTGDARVRGIEIGGGLRGPSWLAASGNLTLLDAEIEATGFPMPGRPDVEYVLRVEIEPPGGLVKLVGEQRYVGEIPLAPGGRVEISARRTWDASLAFDLIRLPRVKRRLPLERLALVVAGTNLGDRSVRDALGFPQPGRSLSFGAEGRY
jgi:outer membrane receptor protein involved in Fe transport